MTIVPARQLFAFLVLGALSACLPTKPPAAHVASLDNFANGTANANHCGMDLDTEEAAPLILRQRGSQILAATPAQRAAVMSVLTAVPEVMQAPFFAAQGTINVTSNVAGLCAGISLSAGERAFAGQGQGAADSCWRQEATGTPPIVYVGDTPAVIRNSLLRAFAYFYEQLLVERLEVLTPTSGDAGMATALGYFVNARRATAAALMADGPRLGAAAPPRLAAFQRLDPRHFEAFVLAEAFDSYYCSPATHATFQTAFPATFKAFSGTSGLTSQFGAAWFQ